MDDVAIIVTNPLVAEPAGVWRAFGAPYWPPDLGGRLYRPLIIAAFALDRMLDGAVWFHAANLLWHGAAAVAVAVLARRWADTTGGLVAGVLFAVHPVHVEAVANVVGRAELLAGVSVVLSVYAALAREAIGWSAAAWALGLLCTENAAVAPALMAWVWVVGGGVARLPVANVLDPAGFYVAERTLYLPSAGLVLAAAGWVARPPRERLWPVVAALAVLAGIRTALRVPVWRDDTSVTLSIITDSPRSYVGPKRMIGYYLDRHAPARALAAARIAAATYGRDPTIYVTGSVAAFALGDSRAADSLLAMLEGLCHRCGGYYRWEAALARAHGYAAAADSLLARSPVGP